MRCYLRHTSVEVVAQKANRSMGNVGNTFGSQGGGGILCPLQHEEVRETASTRTPFFLPKRQKA